MEVILIKSLIIILGLSFASILLCHLARLPTIIGFLITGVIAGTHGLGLIRDLATVNNLSEIGVVLLLFVIGIEFSLKKLMDVKRIFFLGGTLQVAITIIAAFFVSRAIGMTFGEAVFMGFLISLSSTAIVLKVLQERAEMDSPHGSTLLSILVFQDLIMVLLMLFTPLLAGGSANIGRELGFLFLKGLLIMALVIVSARWIIPAVLYQITRTRSRELFLLSIIALCFVIAWLTSSIGLSIGLGAFLAGLIISESEYSFQAISGIIPFRDVLTSFFFISIGMLLDTGFLTQHFWIILLITVVIITIKIFAGFIASFLLGLPLRTVLLVGLGLSSIGEFSFVLSKVGMGYGLLSNTFYQIFLTTSVLTMATAPFIIALSPKIADGILRIPWSKKIRDGFIPLPETKLVEKKDHVIIIGYGINGQHLVRAAKSVGIGYVIIDINSETVRKESKKGEPIIYGDAIHEEVLKHANLKHARIVVIGISDPAATRKITKAVRELSPRAYIIARTLYTKEVAPLRELGADEVIPQEVGTSVEIFTRVMAKYLVPRDKIEKIISEVRSDDYKILSSIHKKSTSLSDLDLASVDISALSVNEGSPVIGKQLGELALRKQYDVTVVAIKRDSQVMPNPGSQTKLYANDKLIVMGTPEKVGSVQKLLQGIVEEEVK